MTTKIYYKNPAGAIISQDIPAALSDTAPVSEVSLGGTSHKVEFVDLSPNSPTYNRKLFQTWGETSAAGVIQAYPTPDATTPTAGPGVTVMAKLSGDAQSAVVAVAATNPLKVLVTLGSGLPGASLDVNWAVVGDDAGTLSTATSATDSTGTAQITYTAPTRTGSYSITATLQSNGASVTFTATATAGAVALMDALTVLTQTALKGTAVAVPPSIIAHDTYGNVCASATIVWAPTGGGGDGAVVGGGTTAATGIATLTSWTLGTTAGLNTLTATSNAIVATFTANGGTPDVATTLAFSSGGTQTGVVAGAAATASVALVTGTAAAAQQGVTVTAGAIVGGGSLNVASRVSDASGLASFTLTTGTTVGVNTFPLTAVGATGTPLTGSPLTASITTVAGTATKGILTTAPPSNVQTGITFPTAPVVQIQDVNGNLCLTNTVNVVAAVTSGTATLTGTTTVAAIAGVATFSNLTLSGQGLTAVITFTPTALTAAVSGTITVASPVATKLAVTTNPTATNTGAIITPPVTVQVQASDGTPVTGSTANITAAISAGASLTGTVTVAAVGGTASFSNLSPTTGSTANYSLTFTSSGLTAATSATFLVTGTGSVHVNEPSGMTPIIETVWTATAGNGWTDPGATGILHPPTGLANKDGYGWWSEGQSYSNRVQVVADATAPKTPAGVLQIKWASTTPGSNTVWMHRYLSGTNGSALTTKYKWVYLDYYIKLLWTDVASTAWTNNTNAGVKFAIVYNSQSGTGGSTQSDTVLTLWSDGNASASQGRMAIHPNSGNFTGSTNATTTKWPKATSTSNVVNASVWRHIEMVMRLETDTNHNDGIAKIWVDGVLERNATNVQYLAPVTTPANEGFTNMEITGTYGGGGTAAPGTMLAYIDGFYISARTAY